MKILVVAHRSETHKPEDFAPHLPAESKKALELVAEDFIREIYSRADAKGAVVIVEAKDEAEARARLGELPLAKAGMLRFEFYPLKPYRGFVEAARA
jgi:hypothetical protein